MMKLLLCVTFACVAGQSLGSARVQRDPLARSPNLTLQSPDSSIAQVILPLMEAWRRAVLKRDTASLVRVALPEYRQAVAKALDDRRSVLSRTLFGGSRSYRAFLDHSSTRIAVFEHHLIVGSHNQAIACFFKGEINWPTDSLGLYELGDRRPVRCLNWVFGEEGEWYVSYGFGMPEGVRRR